jgi:hypothetical protein
MGDMADDLQESFEEARDREREEEDGDELIFVEYDGLILRETDKAIGLAQRMSAKSVDMWIPKSQLHRITYSSGDSKDIHKGSTVEAIEIPRWLANAKELI